MYQIALFRSHYDQLVVGAVDTHNNTCQVIPPNATHEKERAAGGPSRFRPGNIVFSYRSVDVIGVGTSASKGLRKGVVVNVSETTEAIAASVERAKRISGHEIERAHVGVAGAHMSTGPLNAIDNNNPFASSRINYSAELCATCHASGAGHNNYSQWNTLSAEGKGHSNRAVAIAEGTSTSCGRCHGAQGFTVYLDQLVTFNNKGSINNIQIPTAKRAPWSSVTVTNVEPQTCTACHDPHDVTNINQLRVYGDTPMLPAGFQMTGVGKGALCITCHNSRNGVQVDNTLTWLHEDTNTYTGKLGYSAPHQAAQGDVFAGRNAWFMGSGTLPMTSKHAAIEDTCVGCHMALNPKTHLSHGAAAVDGHRFVIEDADAATVCANCHSSSVNGEGIKSATETGLSALATALTNAMAAKMSGKTISVTGAVDTTAAEATIGSGAGSFSGSTVTAVSIAEIHGQVSFFFTTSSPVTFGSASASQFGVQLGNINDNTSGTPTVLYANNGNMVKGGWNYFLIEGGSAFGFHNPSFVQAVLNKSVVQDFSN